MDENYKKFLLSVLPKAKPASGGTEVCCKCLYCDEQKGHFYISLPKNDGELSFFNCFKCPAQGIVTNNTLLEWGVYDPIIAGDLIRNNAKAFKNPKNNKYMMKAFSVKNTFITQDKLSQFKLDYINDRLGTTLTFSDCLTEKIVLNINDLLGRNHITKLTRADSIVEALDNSFIGFLSIDNGYLNMRNLEISKNLPDTINKRYVNYNIFGQFDSTHRFYTSPTNVDLGSPVPIKLHLAEGPFDVLSIKYNLRRDSYNNIYSAIGGNGYLGILKYFMFLLRTPMLEVHYYPDNDVPQQRILNIVELLRPFAYDFYIHRNVKPKEKDFGVPLYRITETIQHVITSHYENDYL